MKGKRDEKGERVGYSSWDSATPAPVKQSASKHVLSSRARHEQFSFTSAPPPSPPPFKASLTPPFGVGEREPIVVNYSTYLAFMNINSILLYEIVILYYLLFFILYPISSHGKVSSWTHRQRRLAALSRHSLGPNLMATPVPPPRTTLLFVCVCVGGECLPLLRSLPFARPVCFSGRDAHEQPRATAD